MSTYVKRNDRAPSEMFEAEAASLDLLRSATSLVIPKVVAVSATALETEKIGPGRPVKDFDERLGRGLAELHRKTADAFGFDFDTYCGATLQPNRWTASWIEFYREHRIGQQLRLLGSHDRVFDRLLARLPELLTEEAPALIHGDLWPGNLLVTADGLPALIDPACYYAHREAELGMMTLFGGFGARVFDAYDESFPLGDGWRERNPLYQMYHVLNHANLFGGGYLSQAIDIARRYA